MKTLTIRLPETLANSIETEAEDRGLSRSDVVRERLQQQPLVQPKDDGLIEVLAQAWSRPARTGLPRFHSERKKKLAQLIRAKKLHR